MRAFRNENPKDIRQAVAMLGEARTLVDGPEFSDLDRAPDAFRELAHHELEPPPAGPR